MTQNYKAMVSDIQTFVSLRFKYTSIHICYLNNDNIMWLYKEEEDNATSNKIINYANKQGAEKTVVGRKQDIHEEVSMYLLLGLYVGTALRFSTPVIRLFVLFWVEEAHPLCTAHIVPVQKSPSFEVLSSKKTDLIGYLQPKR